MVLQPHAMSDAPHAGGLRKRFEVGEDEFRRDLVRYGRFAGFFRMARAGCHTVLDRLTDLQECSKGGLRPRQSILGREWRRLCRFSGSYSSGVPTMGKSSTAILPFGSRSRPGA